MQRIQRAAYGWLGLALALGGLFYPGSAVADAITSWTAGTDAAGDPTYSGYIDSPAQNATVGTGLFTVTGWFVDNQAQGWAGADDIQIWQGTMDGGGLVAEAAISQNRPDVAAALGNPFWAASGFSAFINFGSLPIGNQTLSVYAHTPGKGWW